MTHFTNAAEREAAIRGLDPKKHRGVLAYRRINGVDSAEEYPLWKSDTGALRIGLNELIVFGSGSPGTLWEGDFPTYVLLAVIPHPLPPLPTAFGSVIEATVGGKREKFLLADSEGTLPWISTSGLWCLNEELSDWTIHFDAATIEENQ